MMFWRKTIATFFKQFSLYALLLFPMMASAHLISINATTPFPTNVATSSTTNATYSVVNISTIPLTGIEDQSEFPTGMTLLGNSTCSSTTPLQPGASCTLQLRLNAPSSPTVLQALLRERALPTLDGVQLPISVNVTGVIQYTVTPSAGSGGSISPDAPQTVDADSDLAFSATPDTGYSINQWLVDGSVVQTGGSTYFLHHITANHSVAVTFSSFPSVTSVSPVSGPTTGGTSVVISGADFTDATAVRFGSTSASFTVNSATSITAVSPAGSAGTVHITVTTPAGTSPLNISDLFSYLNAPSVTSISPTTGTISGGTSVTITGTDFTDATAVSFGGIPAASFTVNSATSITAVSPAGSAGTVNVTVTTAGGTSATSSADEFTYVSPPTVTNVSPNTGPTAGGTSVTITGTDFSGATAVSFGATPATSFTVNSATSITAVSPAGSAGIVNVTVTTTSGTSTTSSADEFTYVAPPTITSVTPATGPTAGGTSVTITGTGFTGATSVKFGTTSASFIVNSSSSITATSPAGSAGTIDITVTTAYGTSTTSSADEFTYVSPPTVSSVLPTTGSTAGGTAVAITGTNFADATAVKFGSTPATSFLINGTTSITALSPAGAAGTVDITVTTAGGTSATSSADEFTYVAAPTVTGISPSTGVTAGGTSVIISGTDFTGATDVNFGSSGASFVVLNATTIITTSPAGSAGTVDVTVTTPYGTSAISSADQFTYANTPTVTGISPVAGPLAGGTSVTITGTDFTGATNVRFGSTAATSFIVNSNTSITAVSPAGSAGSVDITVTTAGGTSATSSADQFTYVSAPTVTSVYPNSGGLAGGTKVTITGTNLSTPAGTPAVTVGFGSNLSSSVTVNSDTSITAQVPGSTAGVVDVIVTTAGGSNSASFGDKYTYGIAYGYVADNDSSEVYRCDISLGNGSFSGCTTTNGGASFSIPDTVAFTTASNGTQYGYVIDEGNNVIYQCTLNSTTGAFDTCTGIVGTNINTPTNIAILTVNNAQYAYVVGATSLGAVNIYLCPINSDGTLATPCAQTPSSGAPWTASGGNPLGNAIAINFAPINGTLYAYVTDNQHGASGAGFVWMCQISSNGQLSSCSNALTASGQAGASPAGIDFATSSGTQYAYIGQTNSQNIYQCSFNSNGTFSSCASSTPLSASSRVRNIVFALFNSIQYGYFYDSSSKVRYCVVNTTTGVLNSCTTTPTATTFLNTQGGTIGYIK